MKNVNWSVVAGALAIALVKVLVTELTKNK